MDEIARLPVFGRRQRSGAGAEILFDVLPPECEKDAELATQLQRFADCRY